MSAGFITRRAHRRSLPLKLTVLTEDELGCRLISPEAHLVLPEVISKGPVVRHKDQAWEQIARWTLNCLINAEELRITQDTVARLSSPDSPPAIRRVLGVEGTAGEKLGLEPTWCASIITSLGNYKEVYDRHIGIDTPVGMDRGINDTMD